MQVREGKPLYALIRTVSDPQRKRGVTKCLGAVTKAVSDHRALRRLRLSGGLAAVLRPQRVSVGACGIEVACLFKQVR